LFQVLPLLQVRHGSLAGPGGTTDARAAIAAFPEVVLVDLDGLASNRPDVDLLKESSRKARVWADFGSRTADDAVELFVAGAMRVTIRWGLVRGVDELEEIAEIAEPGALYLGLEFRDGFVPNPRIARLGAEDALDLARKLELPVVAIDVEARGPARRTVGTHAGERWYAAPLPTEELLALEAEGWTGAIGLPGVVR